LSIKDNILLSGSYSGTTPIQLWDLRTMKLLENVKWDEMNDHIETNIFSAQFNKKGKNLFAVGSSNSNNVKIYNMDNQNKPYASLKYLDKPIYSIDFSNNGEYLAFAGAEGNINIISL
jgi:WD40 repeat protein